MNAAARYQDSAAAALAGLGIILFLTVSVWPDVALCLAAAAILGARRGQPKTWRTTLARTLAAAGLVLPVLLLIWYALTV